MNLTERLEKEQFPISVEILPPKRDKDHEEGVYKTKELKRLKRIREKGEELGEIVQGISITEGAGGKDSRFGTQEVAGKLQEYFHGRREIITHLTCLGSTKQEVIEKVDGYLQRGITSILALKGDKRAEPKHEFEHATELTRFLREQYGDKLKILVAAHPEGYDDDQRPYEQRMDWAAQVLKKKQDAGADGAITQMVFDAERYEAFVTRAREYGVTIDIKPGVFVPNPNSKTYTIYEQCKRAEEELHIKIPFMEKLEGKTEEEQEKIVYENVIKLCKELKEKGAPGIHLFTINNVEQTRKVITDITEAKQQAYNTPLETTAQAIYAP